MAIDDPMNDEDEGREAPKAKKGSFVLKLIAIMLSFVVLVAASVGATLFFTGMLGGANGGSDDHGEMAKSTKAKEKPKKKDTKEVNKEPPIYEELGDVFVVNFIENNQLRYLQVKVEVMTRDPEAAEQVKTHMPLIRNNLVMLFSSLDYQTISTVAGKQKIRDEALAEIQSIMKQETGKPGVEAVYFTSFVMQ